MFANLANEKTKLWINLEISYYANSATIVGWWSKVEESGYLPYGTKKTNLPVTEKKEKC